MSQGPRNIRFGLWYDFRNLTQWRQPADRLYREILAGGALLGPAAGGLVVA